MIKKLKDGGIYAIRKHYKEYGLLISIILIIGSALAGAAIKFTLIVHQGVHYWLAENITGSWLGS